MIRILIVDDHAIFCQGLCALLKQYDHLEIVGQASNGKMAIELTHKFLPDVVIMDIEMPKLNGVEATRTILKEMPNIKIIILSMHMNKYFVTELLKIGVLGYVLKNHYFDELLNAINAVITNKRYLSSQIANVIVDDYIKNLPIVNNSPLSRLTDRERQTLILLAEGQTIKQIALRLHISPKTADSYRRQLMEKLELSSLVDLTKFAIREGLAPLDV
jgi:DNA-binding NarL/FixJ family response regulator